jgi:hypothetical protein
MVSATIPGLFLVLYETKKLLRLSIGRYLRNALALHLVPIAAALVFVLSGWSAAIGSSVFGLLGSIGVVGLYVLFLMTCGYLPVEHWLKEIANGDQLSESAL